VNSVVIATLRRYNSSDHRQTKPAVADDDDEVFITRSLNVTLKTTEQRLIVHSGKSEA